MIENNTLEELLLHDEDFPEGYKNMAHPSDYKEVNTFNPEFIYHSYFGRHNRLIIRVAWKVSEDVMIPMSFVCDTGAPSHLYLSKKAFSVLNKYNLILEDDKEAKYVKIHFDSEKTFNAGVEDTPSQHKNANIIGLKALRRLHLNMRDDKFCFNEKFVYL